MAGNDGWVGFSNVRLEQHHKKAIKAAKMTKDEALVWVAEMAEDGYKVTISHDFENGAFLVSLTGKEGENAGLTMTQRHADILTALKAAHYAHVEICAKVWPKPGESQYSYDW